MGMDALREKGNTFKHQSKKKVSAPEPKRVIADVVEAEETPQPKIVRIPRTTSAHMQKRVDKLSGGEALADGGILGKSIETQARRQEITAWMLNGHTHEGELCDIGNLADKLGVPKRTVDTDILRIKERMAEFYTKDDDTRDIAALAHMLLEMKFRDRGNALLLYNRVLQDIIEADAETERRRKSKQFDKMTGFGSLSGRDRAAMYSTALAAIDLANRTTNGMESLLKLTGGAAKLQLIIKAKNVQINKGNGLQMDQLSIQRMIMELMGGVLPSNRGQNKQLELPEALQLDEEDERVLAVGASKGKKVIDAKP